jgi:hypothetical protein
LPPRGCEFRASREGKLDERSMAGNNHHVGSRASDCGTEQRQRTLARWSSVEAAPSMQPTKNAGAPGTLEIWSPGPSVSIPAATQRPPAEGSELMQRRRCSVNGYGASRSRQARTRPRWGTRLPCLLRLGCESSRATTPLPGRRFEAGWVRQ